MVLNPAPGGEETTSQSSQGMPLAEPRSVAAHGLNGAGDDALEEAAASTGEPQEGPRQLQQPTMEIGARGDAFVSEPMVRRIEALSTAPCRSQADKLLDAFSSMPRAPVLDLGIELAVPVAPSDGTADEPSGPASDVAFRDGPPHQPSDVASGEPSDVVSQEAMVTAAEGEDIASSEPKLSPQEQAPTALARASFEPQRPAPGIEPLASALDAAVRLAADASVAAEALEKLKVLLQHKQQLDGLRSAQPVPARLSPSAEISASEAHAIAEPVLPPTLPPLPLPVPAAQAAMGRTRLPTLQRRRVFFERRGLDVRGFMAGFALSWAFGVVLYFYMTAG